MSFGGKKPDGKGRAVAPISKNLKIPQLATVAASFAHNLKSAAGGNAIGDLGSPPSARDRKKQHAFAVETPKREKVTPITDILQNGSSRKSHLIKNLYGQGTKPGNMTNKSFHENRSKFLPPCSYGVSPSSYGVSRATPSAGKNSSRQMSAAKHHTPVLQLTESSEPPIISPSDPRDQNLRAPVTKPKWMPRTVPQGNFYGHSSGNGSSSSRCSRISSCIILLQKMTTCLCKS